MQIIYLGSKFLVAPLLYLFSFVIFKELGLAEDMVSYLFGYGVGMAVMAFQIKYLL